MGKFVYHIDHDVINITNSFIDKMKTMPPDDRKDVFVLLAKAFCSHCGENAMNEYPCTKCYETL